MVPLGQHDSLRISAHTIKGQKISYSEPENKDRFPQYQNQSLDEYIP